MDTVLQPVEDFFAKFFWIILLFFRQKWFSRCQQKQFIISFFAYYFLKVHLLQFSEIKSHKEGQKIRIRTNSHGSGSERHKKCVKIHTLLTKGGRMAFILLMSYSLGTGHISPPVNVCHHHEGSVRYTTCASLMGAYGVRTCSISAQGKFKFLHPFTCPHFNDCGCNISYDPNTPWIMRILFQMLPTCTCTLGCSDFNMIRATHLGLSNLILKHVYKKVFLYFEPICADLTSKFAKSGFKC